jgi:hypothetical protein
MGIVEILGVAGSVSLLAGWRIYLCVFATGLAMRMGWIDAPQHLQALDVLADNWVLGASAVGLVAEFFADKIAWIDSLWDAVHTAVRPIGGAVLALALVDASDPVWQVVTLLLGGGAALMSHSAKAGTRAIPQKKVNAITAPMTPRRKCSRITSRRGQGLRVAKNIGPPMKMPVACLHSIALYAPTAIDTAFIAPSITENNAMPTQAARKGKAIERGMVGAIGGELRMRKMWSDK